MSQKTSQEPEGMNPQEVVGIEDSESSLRNSSVDIRELHNDGADVDYSPRDVTADSFKSERIEVGISPHDGLPQPNDAVHHLPIAAPFNEDALVCMADERTWVEMWSVELPPEVSQAKFSSRSRWSANGQEHERRTFSPDQVELGQRWGVSVVQTSEGLVPVRPIRPACVHYRRSVFCADPNVPAGEFGHEEMHRNCMIRRSVGGAFMSLSSEAVYACELREPRDPSSEQKYIVAKDNARLSQKIENVPLFNLE